MAIGVPPLFVATGIAAVLLVAGDLAEQLRGLVARDALTGVLNRRGLEEAAAMIIANARRHGRDLTVVVADIDNFKALNDQLGHSAGDRALIAFTERSEEHTSEPQSLMRNSYAVFCLTKKTLYYT